MLNIQPVQISLVALRYRRRKVCGMSEPKAKSDTGTLLFGISRVRPLVRPHLVDKPHISSNAIAHVEYYLNHQRLEIADEADLSS